MMHFSSFYFAAHFSAICVFRFGYNRYWCILFNRLIVTVHGDARFTGYDGSAFSQEGCYLHAYLHVSDTHVTPLLKIMATGLDCLYMVLVPIPPTQGWQHLSPPPEFSDRFFRCIWVVCWVFRQ